MDESRRPRQLEIKRKQHYDNVYGKQKQLMKRLRPLLHKSDVVEEHTKPSHHSLKKTILAEPILNDKTKKTRKKLEKALNVFESKKKKSKIKTAKKISEIRPDVLWGLSLN